MPTFAENLHKIRRERGVTQEQLSQEMNVSRQTISHWENGRAVPDVDTIRQLSQILNYDFLAVEGVTEELQAAPETEEIPAQTEVETAAVEAAQETPVPLNITPPRKKWLVLPAVLEAVLLCAVLIVCLLMNGKPSGERANVTIVSAENSVKAIRFDDFPDGVGWLYEFRIEETGGVPFTIHELINTIYSENGSKTSQTFTAEQLAGFWGSATLTQNIPQPWTGGFPLQPVKGVDVVLKGADANGNELEFTGYIELSKEISE